MENPTVRLLKNYCEKEIQLYYCDFIRTITILKYYYLLHKYEVI